nr:CDP-glycerol glycerophosphotransferase family protein [Natronosporangium hydrolyticum]
MGTPFDRRLARRALRTLGPTVLALTSFALLLLLPTAGPGLAAGWASLLVSGWVTFRDPLGRHIGPRAVVAAGSLAAAYGTAMPGLLTALSGAVLLGLLLTEAPLRDIAGPRYRATGLPLAEPRLDPRSVAKCVWGLTTALIVSVGLAGLWSPLAWLPPVLTVAALVGSGMLFADAWDRRRRNRGADLLRLREALTQLNPRFILYFSAPPGMEYQAQMWLPYLERIGEPYFVVLREGHARKAISAATTAPVVVCPSLAALDAALVPSVRAAFYVNNGMKNSHCVRFAELQHIQLLHGDSDKAPSFNPVTAMFDQIFVAGQAAIDRYAANGVQIPAEKFRIVGRPQVESLTVVEPGDTTPPEPTVLYAPTWIGLYNDVNYCSLPIGEQIVQELLRHGATVILRHHPFATRDRGSAVLLHRIEQLLAADRDRTGRSHLWGAAASTELSLFECIDASHAMVSDVSSVASDFLYTGKPFAITDMLGEGAEFVRTFPLASAAYVIQPDASNLTDAVASLLGKDLVGKDLLADARRAARTHYLGDFPPDRYAEGFVAQARLAVAGTSGASGVGPLEGAGQRKIGLQEGQHQATLRSAVPVLGGGVVEAENLPVAARQQTT